MASRWRRRGFSDACRALGGGDLRFLRLPLLILALIVLVVRPDALVFASSEPDPAAAAAEKSSSDPVSEAIAKCRSKIRDVDSSYAAGEDGVNPYAFPKTRYRLAMMLESRLPHWMRDSKSDGVGASTSASESQLSNARECAAMYESSSRNETHGFPPSVRVGALIRAAELTLLLPVDDGGEDYYGSVASAVSVEEMGREDRAEGLLRSALDVRGRDPTTTSSSGRGGEEDEEDPSLLPSAHASAFEALVRLLLRRSSNAAFRASSTGATGADGGGNGNEKGAEFYLTSALELCRICSKLCPDEPVIDEYRGAILRKLHASKQAAGGKSKVKHRPLAFATSPILGGGPPSDSDGAAREVYGCYESAARKSYDAAVRSSVPSSAGEGFAYGTLPPPDRIALPKEDDASINVLSQLWTRLIRHAVLAAASAGEASLDDAREAHLSFGMSVLARPDLLPLVDPTVSADLFVNAGIRLKTRGDAKGASEMFRKALEVHPNDGHALVQLASLGDENAASETSEMSDEYVAGLFDGYSDRFEGELVDELEYKGHVMTAEALLRHWTPSADRGGGGKSEPVAMTVVDLGCGTGLLGSILRENFHKSCSAPGGKGEGGSSPSSLSIHGVDLSPRMASLSRAREWDTEAASASITERRRVYDDVRVSDAEGYLKSLGDNTIDAVTASDVFIYVGALEGIFGECRRTLRPGGLVAFTVESPPPPRSEGGPGDGGTGVRLLRSGRFGHTRGYIEKTASSSGLAVLEWKEEVLRKQGGEDVAGAVVVLRLSTVNATR